MSAAERFLASGSMDGTVRVWELATDGALAAQVSTIYTFDLHVGEVFAVAWSPDGTRLASAGRDRRVQVWDVETGEPVCLYEGHTEAVYALAWSPDSAFLASAGRDKQVAVWDAETGEVSFSYYGHAQPVYTLAWSPDGTRIASGGADKLVQVWDAGSADLIWSPPQPGGAAVYAIAWSPQGRHLAIAGDGVELFQWKWDDEWNKEWGMRLARYEGHTQVVYTMAWSPDGARIASSGYDKTVQVWDPETAKPLVTYADHSGYVRAVAWSPDGKQLASASRDGTVQVWEAVSGQPVTTYREHQQPVFAVAWAPAVRDEPTEAELAAPAVEEAEEEAGNDGQESTGSLPVPPLPPAYSPPLYTRPHAAYSVSPLREAPGPTTSTPFAGLPPYQQAPGTSPVYDWTPPPSPFTIRASNSRQMLSYIPFARAAPRRRRRRWAQTLLVLALVLLILCLLACLGLWVLRLWLAAYPSLLPVFFALRMLSL
jgi:WD40 repeat protein